MLNAIPEASSECVLSLRYLNRICDQPSSKAGELCGQRLAIPGHTNEHKGKEKVEIKEIMCFSKPVVTQATAVSQTHGNEGTTWSFS